MWSKVDRSYYDKWRWKQAHIRAARKKYRRRPEIKKKEKAQVKAYRKTPKGRAMRKKQKKLWKERQRQKRAQLRLLADLMKLQNALKG